MVWKFEIKPDSSDLKMRLEYGKIKKKRFNQIEKQLNTNFIYTKISYFIVKFCSFDITALKKSGKKLLF